MWALHSSHAVGIGIGIGVGEGADVKRTPTAVPPGGRLSRTNVTPWPTSRDITGAQWLTGRSEPPSNQWGDIHSSS